MDQQHFIKLYAHYYPIVRNSAFAITKDSFEADDITSCVFTKFWELRDSIINYASFLSSLTSQEALDYIRAKKKKTDHQQAYLNFIQSIYAETVDLYPERERFRAVIAAFLDISIKNLPERKRQVVTLYYKAGLRVAQIADSLNMSRASTHRYLSSTIIDLKRKAEAVFLIGLPDGPYRQKPGPIESLPTIPPDTPNRISIIKDEINAELIKYLGKHPTQLTTLSPRKFEELVAALMKDMGYDIYLTPLTKDKGRDIIATIKIPPGKEVLTIVQCKNRVSGKKVGMEVIERFLYTVTMQDKANVGWVVSTTGFTADAKKKQQEYKNLLSLYDSDHLKHMCSNYGKWKIDGSSGLWLPDNTID